MHALQREACAWMYRAAELGVVEAQAELGRALTQGRPGLLLDKPLPLAQVCFSSSQDSLSFSHYVDES